jgi:hypothetical protein
MSQNCSMGPHAADDRRPPHLYQPLLLLLVLQMHAMDDLSHAFCLSSAENSVVSQLVHHSVTAGAGAVNPAADRLAVTGRGRAALREAAAPSSA